MKYFRLFLFYSFIFFVSWFSGIVFYQYIHLQWPLRKACLYIWETDKNNHIFETNIFFRQLKEEFLKRGYDLSTHDINSIHESDLILYVNARAPLPPESYKNKSYAWFVETPFIIDLLYKKDKHHLFKKIFTYNKDLVDNEKYHYMQSVYSFDPYEEIDMDKKTVLSMQIASNLNYVPSRSLYFERRNLVKWFIENHPEDFEFYGNGWNKMKSTIQPESQQDFERQYKGYVKNKKETAKKAKFVFAYENSLSKNYISEKIWDVMNAGSVPIYLGADDIEEYVPKTCFINKKDFNTYEELYDTIKNMSDETYRGYISCIKNFVTQPKEKSQATDVVRSVNNIISVIFEKGNFIDQWIYFVNRF